MPQQKLTRHILNNKAYKVFTDSSLKKQGISTQKVVNTQVASIMAENKITTSSSENIEKNIILSDTITSEKSVTSETLTYIVIGTFFNKTRADKLKTESVNNKFSTLISDDNNDGLFVL